jgi:hypothetical protein
MSGFVSWRLVFLSFSFSISSGLCFMRIGHTLLHSLGLPGFTLPGFTSTELGAIGGLFLALPILSLRSLPQDLSNSFGAPFQFCFFSSVVAIGAAQGYVGAKVLEGYKIILGVGCASVAGATGATILVLPATILFTFATHAMDRAHEQQAERNRPQ